MKLLIKRQKVGARASIVSFSMLFTYTLIILIIDLHISYIILLLSIIALFFYSYVGFYLQYFKKSRVFDRFLHGYGTFTFTLLVYESIIIIILNGGSKFYQALFVFFLGIALGSIHEIIEFIADMSQHSQMQKGLRDTNFDMVFNVLGAAAAAAAAYLFII
jgi:hypothetical protein